MSSWLVVDLRACRLAIALLDVNADKIRWLPQSVTIYPLPGTYTNIFETDLAFYKADSEKYWTPTLITSQSNFPADFEFILNLLEKPIEEIKELLLPTIYPILKTLLKEYKNIPLIFLIDRDDLRSVIKEFGQKIKRKTVSVSKQKVKGEIEGFALLPPNLEKVPTNGDTISCLIHTGKTDEEMLTYRWKQDHFVLDSKQAEPHLNGSIWDSLGDLRRAGTVLYALVWHERINGSSIAQIDALRQENSILTRLRNQMKDILTAVRN